MRSNPWMRSLVAGTITIILAGTIASGLSQTMPRSALGSSTAGRHQVGRPHRGQRPSATLIHTAADLQNIQNNLSGNYALANNIDASGFNFTPIGSSGSPFTGVLDGGGFEIAHLGITSSSQCTAGPSCGVGLFAFISPSGEVKNLRLASVSLSWSGNCNGTCAIGSVAGINSGTIDMVLAQGTLDVEEDSSNYTGFPSIGGIAGENNGVIELSTSAVNINSMGSGSGSELVAGGVAGDNEGSVQYALATGTVSVRLDSDNGSYSGGIAGSNEGPISLSTSTGNVSCNSSGNHCFAGGLVGFFQSGQPVSVTQSSANGAVTSSGPAGGLIGATWSSDDAIEQSFARGSVQSTSAGSGEYDFAGGLIGFSESTTVDQSFAAGEVQSPQGNAGGLIGYNYGKTTITSSYWDVNTSGVSNAGCGGGVTCSGVVGLTTQEFQDGKLDYVAGFDATVWLPMNTAAVQQHYYPQLWALSFPIGNFPLAFFDPYTVPIVTVFDHSLETTPGSGIGALYAASCDLEVEAFTGQMGLAEYGSDESSCDQAGYEQKSHAAFALPGVNYRGDSADSCPKCYLNYEGHPGYDLVASLRTPVFAATSGSVFYPWKAVGTASNYNTYCTFHTMAEIPDSGPAYRIYYLHLTTHPAVVGRPPCTNGQGSNGQTVGFLPRSECNYTLNGQRFFPMSLPLPQRTHVQAGCEIALSGDAGVPGAPHLHFEVQQIVPSGADINSLALSYFHCWNENNGYQSQTNAYCLPADPYGWTPIATANPTSCGSNPADWTGDIWYCLTGIPGRRFWTQ